jgi:hypothetical protein
MDIDKIRDLEKELIVSTNICEKCFTESYAQNLYAALCNTVWQAFDVLPILKNETWSCSWRHSGAIVAHIRNMIIPGASNETYIDWYCSGMAVDVSMVGAGTDMANQSYELLNTSSHVSQYVPEGVVTDEIREDLKNLGWKEVTEEEEDE